MDPDEQNQWLDEILGGYDSSGASQKPTVVTGKDGRMYRVDLANNRLIPLEGMTLPWPDAPKAQTIQITDQNDGSQWLVDTTSRQKVMQLSGPIPGWVPGLGVPKPQQPQQAPMRAPQTPEEVEAARLKNRFGQRDLGEDTEQARTQFYQIVGNLQNELASGKIDEREADRLSGLAKGQLTAAMKGTTPWQLAQNQEGVAQDIFTKRLSSGGSMAQGLMRMFDDMLPGPNANEAVKNWDPLKMAQGFAEDVYGGKELTPFARGVLMSALGGPNPATDPMASRGGPAFGVEREIVPPRRARGDREVY